MHDSLLTFILDDELKFFQSRKNKGEQIHLPYREFQSYKHLIESLGIPHTEIGQIIVNNINSDINMLSRPGDIIEVNSKGHSLQEQERKNGFVLDNHLGRLTRYLRLLGFDSLYSNQLEDSELANVSVLEQRILLTRDRQLLMRSKVNFGYYVRSLDPWKQLDELCQRYDLYSEIRLFGRCAECNTVLIQIEKDKIIDRLEPLTRTYFERFHVCVNCDRIYWEGSHYLKMCQAFRTHFGSYWEQLV